MHVGWDTGDLAIQGKKLRVTVSNPTRPRFPARRSACVCRNPSPQCAPDSLPQPCCRADCASPLSTPSSMWSVALRACMTGTVHISRIDSHSPVPQNLFLISAKQNVDPLSFTTKSVLAKTMSLYLNPKPPFYSSHLVLKLLFQDGGFACFGTKKIAEKAQRRWWANRVQPWTRCPETQRFDR